MSFIGIVFPYFTGVTGFAEDLVEVGNILGCSVFLIWGAALRLEVCLLEGVEGALVGEFGRTLLGVGFATGAS
jgi:hypothetical protein